MSARTIVESICGGNFLYKNANNVWEFLEDLIDETYELETIGEAPSIASKIFMDNEGKLRNDFIALEDTMLY